MTDPKTWTMQDRILYIVRRTRKETDIPLKIIAEIQTTHRLVERGAVEEHIRDRIAKIILEAPGNPYRVEMAKSIAMDIIEGIEITHTMVPDEKWERVRDAAQMAADEYGAESRVGLQPGDLGPMQ